MNAHGKSIDKTYLSIDLAEDRGFIHRDYIAHCLRWSHVAKMMMQLRTYDNAVVLDVGCGRELPLAKLLYSSRMFPKRYIGVDYGPIDDFSFGKYDDQVKLYEREDFVKCALLEGQEAPTHVVCFEVLEHVEPVHMLNMLRRIKQLARKSADIFISTPCWNVTDCAGNHVNEMKFVVLGSLFVRLGFKVFAVHGTFASRRDYEHLISPELKTMFNKLSQYYDSNFLSCIFAPMFPAQSRNALWHLRLVGDSLIFPKLETIQQPWSSSAAWPKIEEIEDETIRADAEPAPELGRDE